MDYTLLVGIEVGVGVVALVAGLIGWLHRNLSKRFDTLEQHIEQVRENQRQHEKECGLRNEAQERELGKLNALLEAR